MTAKRDLKRRVRQRQARTGESYVTARRRVLAAREGRSEEESAEEAPSQDAHGADGERHGRASAEAAAQAAEPAPAIEAARGEGESAASGVAGRVDGESAASGGAGSAEAAAGEVAAPMPVIELHEWTEQGLALGFRVRITVYPTVVELAEPETVLAALRDALVRGAKDPTTARMFEVAFGVGRKRMSKPGARIVHQIATLTFSVPGRDGAVDVACRVWTMAPTLMLRRADEYPEELFATARGAALRSAPSARLELMRLGLPRPTLFVIHDERRYPVTRDPFVIGRNRVVADLALDSRLVSSEHAAVISRNGKYYLKDLGSENGIHHKGMQIDNKRIDEGDVFQVGEQQLRFTFREDG